MIRKKAIIFKHFVANTCRIKNITYICTRLATMAQQKTKAGCSAVRLAHLVWDQGVGGSNPSTPTFKDQFSLRLGLFLCPFFRHEHTEIWACPRQNNSKFLTPFLGRGQAFRYYSSWQYQAGVNSFHKQNVLTSLPLSG